VPNDGFRDVPDLAVTTSPNHDGYITCSNGSCVVGLRGANPVAGCASEGYSTPCGAYTVSGGTSAASPSFAGIIALLDQKNQARQGLINQNLYTLASISTNAFHDITVGNNIVPCTGGSPNCSSTAPAVNGTLGFSAGVGYDQVTGLGSIDAYNMVEQWNDNFSVASNPTTLTINPGSSGTATLTVSPLGTFTGNVTFTCTISSAITNTTCSIPGTVSNGSGSATLTITAGTSARTPWWRHIQTPPSNSYRDLLFALAALMLGSGIYLAARQRSIRMFSFAAAALLVVGLSSCGGGGSSSTTTTTTSTGPTTPASVTGEVTITATSGSLVNYTTIALTIP
jgi:subtilase family serine protease